MNRYNRVLLFSLLALIFICITPTLVTAEAVSKSGSPSGFLQLYKTEDNLSCALKFRLLSDLYGGTNIEYFASDLDTKIHLGAVYLLPHEFLFFRFYGGVGYQFSRNNGGEFSYLVLGSHYLFLFSEVLYPWEIEEEPLVRFGLSFKY
jgi:hypothetical protein